MTTSSEKKKALSPKEFRQTFTRSMTLDSAWNYERQQHINFCYMMIPALKRIYGDNKEELSKALKRHLEFMACTPHIVTFLAGIMIAMEEENAADPDFDESSISAVKTSLMGPMAGIGDSLIWGTLLTIAVGVGTSFASQGSILGPILFFLIINVPCFLLRYYCLGWGYSSGSKFFTQMQETGLVNRITKVASVLGLLVIGSMIAAQVSVETVVTLNVSGMETPLQDYFDQIMPCFLPLITFFIMYRLLDKKVRPTTILIWLVVFGCVTAALGIF
jgi:fructoselysine and glucoselysine-specific PTS system IID component